MILIVCVDEKGGILFNHRRVSSDRAVIDDILGYIGDSSVYMREYSMKLFPSDAKTLPSDDYLRLAESGDTLFLEESMPVDLLDRVGKVVVYHWNRLYPADVKFPLEQLRDRFRLESTFDFKGNSHDQITREVYVR